MFSATTPRAAAADSSCAKTRAATAASKRWTPSRHSNSATRRGYGTRRGRWPKARATCSRSTSRPPRRRSTSCTAARSSQENIAPVSIMIFFLISSAGRHHPQGRLGLPVVVSIIFFVIYYIISLSGETGWRGQLGSRIRHLALDVHPHADRRIPDLQGHQRLGIARHGLVCRKTQGIERAHATCDQQIEKRDKTQTKWQKGRF